MSSITWKYPSFLSLRPLKSAVKQRALRFARKRQGRDGIVATLESRRVYILPTGVGLVFALMTFAMLLGSMNYNNNLSFVLTFLLVSLGLIAMHQCQRNLVGLEIAFAGVDAVFAGQNSEFRIAINNHSKNYRYNFQVYVDKHSSQIGNVGPGESVVFHLELPTDKRGYVELPRFGIRTTFPFELFRAWAWLHMDLRGLVYPHPVDDAPQPPAVHSDRGHRQHDARGEEDFAGLRNFQQGDAPRHVAWKAFARSGELYSKLFSGADTSTQWFDFAQVPAVDTEDRLAILSRWILDADRAQRDYGLRLPGNEFRPAHGSAHRHECLKALALFGLDHEISA